MPDLEGTREGDSLRCDRCGYVSRHERHFEWITAADDYVCHRCIAEAEHEVDNLVCGHGSRTSHTTRNSNPDTAWLHPRLRCPGPLQRKEKP